MQKSSDKIGIIQINPKSGDLETNSKDIKKYISIAQENNIKYLFFPKFALVGNDLENFIKRYPFFIEETKKWLNSLAKLTSNITVLLGFWDSDYKFKYAVLENGCINKILSNDLIFSKEFNCKTEFIVNFTPTHSGTLLEELRSKDLIKLSKKQAMPILHINQIGSENNSSYSGNSSVYTGENLIAKAKDFEEDFLIVDLSETGFKTSNTPIIPQDFSLDYEWDLERTYKTLIQGIKDYFNKCGLKRAVLGLSGGLDSTICAVLLVDALGKENVFGVSMPSKLTSNESKTDALELAQNLGIGFAEHSIKPMFETTNTCLSSLFNDVEKVWEGRYSQSFTPDNIQARSRAIYLWGIANEFSSCVPIATSDKSEAYMGYATINGDMSGGFAPIADVVKTKLFALARWMNKNREIKNVIPESIILKKPGAELAIDPNTGKTLNAEDALMPYEFLDEIIWRIENKHQSYQELLEATFLYENKENVSKEQKIEWLNKFFRRMSTSYYKWSILPPSVKVEDYGINKIFYSQPITSSGIDFKGKTQEEIDKILLN